ncbi:hypothetical protein J6590_022235 [Homalodisca vitripennis]|nr:hypothetical protein J6590_022235 [Homalodisca vitripennis]
MIHNDLRCTAYCTHVLHNERSASAKCRAGYVKIAYAEPCRFSPLMQVFSSRATVQ